MSASPPRVAITGIGMASPLGTGREVTWQALCAGASATRWLPNLATGAAVYGGPRDRAAGAPAVLPVDRAAEELDPVVQLALAAAAEAVGDARLTGSAIERRRLGCVIGASKGGLRIFARLYAERRGVAPAGAAEQWNQLYPSSCAAAVAAAHDAQGAALCPVAACATGLVSIARGADLIQSGQCDAVLAGSSDASLLPVLLASYRRLGVLARGFDDPATGCRPFDRRRNGFLVGEGAAVLVLERLEHAQHRGAAIYAEWLGGAAAADSAHLTRMPLEPDSLAWVIRAALAAARVAPEEIDYVNLHGTATRQNDAGETWAVKAALGAAARRVCCSTLKGAIGHLLGAAGSMELAATLLALRDGVVPPTVNLDEPDPACDLDYTPRTARHRPLGTALKISLGFGGHMAAAVVRRLP